MTPRPLCPSYGQLADSGRLLRAWRRVWRGNGAFGGDGQTVAQFAERAAEELARLRTELVDRRYRPGALRVCRIPKPDGTQRRLQIPSVRDRVVQQAALSMLGPWFEPEFAAASWAYRPGRSHVLALASLRRAWLAGYRWIAEGDVDGFFDHIDRARLGGLLDRTVPDRALVAVAMAWMGGRTGRGIPQGAPLSPLLSNLYLDAFDEEVGLPGRRLVRFGDDFVVATRSASEAGDALSAARRALAALALRLEETKTAIRSPADATAFLGSVLQDGALEVRRPTRLAPLRRATRRAGDGWHVWFDRRQRAAFMSGSTPLASTMGEVEGGDRGTPHSFRQPPARHVAVTALRELLNCPHAAYRLVCLGQSPVAPAMAEGLERHKELASADRGSSEVPVFCRSLRLSGVIDSVEQRGDAVVAVELKTGLARRPTFADQVQVAAYMLALLESHVAVAGEVAFTRSGRREPVTLTPFLLTRTRLLARQLHDIADGRWVPTNRRRPACPSCRHKAACQPDSRP